jgi:hypothetical protein
MLSLAHFVTSFVKRQSLTGISWLESAPPDLLRGVAGVNKAIHDRLLLQENRIVLALAALVN